MQSIKNAVGLGTDEQQGREPVNGETGAGTTGEPYDQGNSGGKFSHRDHWRLQTEVDSVLDPSKGGEAPQFTNDTSNGSNGLGNGTQQGREPVNGLAGPGTASEPYDQGNSDGTLPRPLFPMK